jgi:hypothetical protein
VPASGDAVVVWDEDGDGDGADDVGLVRLAKADGAVNLARRTANATVTGRQGHSAVAANNHGDVVVAWESDHTGTPGVWTRSFTSTGTPRHADVAVASGTGVADPVVGVDDGAATVVGWSLGGADPDVWLRGLNPDGTTTGRLAAQVLSRTATGRQDQLALAVSPWGEVPLAYTDDSDGNEFDQVLLGIGATNSDW